ncbi:uncharacterized protein [Panulirus ornatus]|uniref:uncharacterized protein isoform X2 n=1 Tax=Panulirus ornatus TaxID=150431 RepID=UPI003A872170
MRTNRQTTSFSNCVLGIVLLVSLSALTAGVMIWMNQGLSSWVIVLITCGGIILLLIIVSIIAQETSSFSREPSSSLAVTQIQDDPPPTYRNTWRLEYIEKIPASLKLKLQSTRPKRHTSKRDVRAVWTSTEVGVHGGIPTTEYVYTNNEMTEGHSSVNIFLPDGRHSSVFQSWETGSSDTPERTNTLSLNLHNVQPFSLDESSSGSISVIPSRAAATIHQSFDNGLPSYDDVQGESVSRTSLPVQGQ